MPRASDRITVLAPTGFEYAAHRLFLPRAAVAHAGIGLSRGVAPPGAVVVSGLAGGLATGYPPGTVVIPREVRTEGGPVRRCDPDLVAALTDAARSLGFNPRHEPLLTAGELVTGPQRARWAAQGFVACDMETALLPDETTRFATVRVILDTEEHSISERWVAGPRAALDLRLWRELAWLAKHAPRFALRAARITRLGLAKLASQPTRHPRGGP